MATKKRTTKTTKTTKRIRKHAPIERRQAYLESRDPDVSHTPEWQEAMRGRPPLQLSFAPPPPMAVRQPRYDDPKHLQVVRTFRTDAARVPETFGYIANSDVEDHDIERLRDDFHDQRMREQYARQARMRTLGVEEQKLAREHRYEERAAPAVHDDLLVCPCFLASQFRAVSVALRLERESAV
jgi:hypothetical protein